jgi:DNA repair exonuclease SbcCD ATPase subunit
MSKCTVEPHTDCQDPVVATYQWPWGESGLTCAKHQTVLAQRAAQLKRSVVIAPLEPGNPTPLDRTERTAFHAQILALQEECDELKKRGLELYRANESLQDMIRTEQAKRASLEASLGLAHEELAGLRVRNGELEVAAARENAELQQLRALVSPEPIPLPRPDPIDPIPVG